MPAYCHPAAFDAFERELPALDSTSGLFRAAFAIALHENPSSELAKAETTIADLAETVRRRVKSENLDARLAHLHDVLFDVVGFAGNLDDYYNPANSYLPEVLRTRRGLPITLVLIYKAVGERVGLRVCGVNSPGHFLAAVEADRPGEGTSAREPAGRMYVDPFFGGELLNENDISRRIVETTGAPLVDPGRLLPIATHRAWLMRMLNNLQAVFAHTGRQRDLFAMQELQELLNSSVTETRRRGRIT